MFRDASESDITSTVPSTSSSPPAAAAAYYLPSTSSSPPAAAAYYVVQSPCIDGNDEGYKCSPYNSFLRTSTNSVTTGSSRVSGPKRKWDNRKRGYFQRIDEKCYVDEEDGTDYLRETCSASWRCFVILLAFSVIFTAFCFTFWAASRPNRVRVGIQSLEVHNMYYGEGSDITGVRTKLLTVNCSARMIISNPATFFGIHISSNPVKLMYSEIAIANGQIEKYYQPRNSKRTMRVRLIGYSVPLYGVGWELAASDESGGIPLTLEFDIHSTGHLVGNLVKTKHTRRISCAVVISSKYTKEITFEQESCKYF